MSLLFCIGFCDTHSQAALGSSPMTVKSWCAPFALVSLCISIHKVEMMVASPVW